MSGPAIPGRVGTGPRGRRCTPLAAVEMGENRGWAVLGQQLICSIGRGAERDRHRPGYHLHRMSLRTNPEGSQKLAGGEAPGTRNQTGCTPEGCRKIGSRTRFQHPSGVRPVLGLVPGVSPPANFRHPSGMAEARYTMSNTPLRFVRAGRPPHPQTDRRTTLPQTTSRKSPLANHPSRTTLTNNPHEQPSRTPLTNNPHEQPSRTTLQYTTLPARQPPRHPPAFAVAGHA